MNDISKITQNKEEWESVLFSPLTFLIVKVDDIRLNKCYQYFPMLPKMWFKMCLTKIMFKGTNKFILHAS